jgi:high-affinity K+ transport system ATPase subunit B
MLFSVSCIFLLGIVGINFTGNYVEVSQEDIDLIVYYLIEILKVTLGYLVGRGFRFVFEKR